MPTDNKAWTPKVWLVYVDQDGSGSREEWNVFYTPCEVYLDENLAKQREAFLNEHCPDGWAVYMCPALLRTSLPQGTPTFDIPFRWGADDDDEGYDNDDAEDETDDDAPSEDKEQYSQLPAQILDLDD